ncbi:MAG: helix-turn-helix domain-containing protein [Rhodobacteraceae bacterium]|nr:helix-turn-helix domain-containing protein [Paracoccaceae bacterium]
MARETLTGSRIRERRLIAGLRQADLARDVGISASYLNLIEHNRRRIGGKLLVDIAQVLGVEPSMLTEGAEAALIATLREAAANAPAPVAETDRAEEFAGRFPGWAEVLAGAHRRVASLERTVQTLSDRLTHDPHLAASLHEVLSTAAAIRSTASILAETGELEPEWQDRFHKNINQDAQRLAESSRALVTFLDESDTEHERRGVPQEEVETFFSENEFHFPSLEDGSGTPDDLIEGAEALASKASRTVARVALTQYAEDAALLPLERFSTSLAAERLDPMALAREFGCDLQTIFRRLAAMPQAVLGSEVGLVLSDASGSTLFRKPVADFALPRFGASCPLWPLFSAFSRPQIPIRRRVSQVGRSVAVFDCFAVAWPQEQPDFDQDPVYHGAMLILPVLAEQADQHPAQPVGSSCPVCPRAECRARREPSILSEEF